MKSNSLIIVESPFQLLCAYEIICALNLKYDLVIRLSGHIQNDKQLKKMVKLLKFKREKYIYLSPNKNIFSLYKMVFFSTKYSIKNYEYYILGDYLSGFLKLFSKFINKKKVLLLDDGVATLKIQESFIKNNKFLNLFTIFNIVPIENQNIIKHKFENLRKKYLNTNIRTNNSIYIGENLVELEILDLEKYIEIVKTVAEKEEETLYYFPHRLSSGLVIERVKNIKNIEIVYPKVSLEYYLLLKGINPKNIYSILSTALISLQIIYPNSTITAFKPKFNLTNRSNDIENLFIQMAKYKGIKVEAC